MSTAVLHDLPMPARLAPWPRASRTTLVRCLWLAALLHLWAVLWLGSAPEGTAPPGQGVQGRLNVTLRGVSDDGLPSAPPAQVGPATAAEAPPRLGGRVRDTPLPADAAPGAERLGDRLPVPAAPAAVPNLAAPAPTAQAAPLPSLPSLNTPAPLAALPSVPAAAPRAAVPDLAAPAPEAAAARLPELAPLPSAPAPAPAAAERRLDPAALRQLIPAPAAPLVAPAPVAAPTLPTSPLPALGGAVAAPGPDAAATATPAAPAAEAGPRLGADIAVPAAAASAPKRLNLELGRLRGGELSRHGTAGVLPVLPRPPETDKLAAEIEKAARTDCRTAHAGAGLLAVVPLAIDTARGKGCKW